MVTLGPTERSVRCARCSRGIHYCGPLDTFGTCISCARVIKEQVAAGRSQLVADCDALGRFHEWCRRHDEGSA